MIDELEIVAEGFENSRRKTILKKVLQAYAIYKELITYYGISQLVNFSTEHKIGSWENFKDTLPFRAKRESWINMGTQLFPQTSVDSLIKQIHSGKIKNWDAVHQFYQKNGDLYKDQKLQHAFASLLEINKLNAQKFDKKAFRSLLDQAVNTREWMTKAIYDSREKDYHNDFRKMVYDSQKQMDKVLGKLEDNSFIKQQEAEFLKFKRQVGKLVKLFKL